METIKNKVFQVDSEIIQKARKLDNYLLVKDEILEGEEEVFAVYFSSNYIYFPNKEETFQKAIIEKNRFEWYNLRHPKANRHLFIRDIYKQWYLHGINYQLNSIEKLTDFIKSTIGAHKSYFIGSSAGGYMAVLAGSLLNVDRIYAFNNQFFLTDLLTNSSVAVDPIIFREQHNPQIKQYFHIKKYIKNPNTIYYFHSNKSQWDIDQYKEVKDIGMHVININTKVHGIPILKNNLVPLFAMDEDELSKLTTKSLHPITTSQKIIGNWETGVFLIQLIPDAFRRWVYNPIQSYLQQERNK